MLLTSNTIQDRFYGHSVLSEKSSQGILWLTRKYLKYSKTFPLKHYCDLNNDQKQRLNVMLYTSKEYSNTYVLKESFYNVMEVPDYYTTKERLT